MKINVGTLDHFRESFSIVCTGCNYVIECDFNNGITMTKSKYGPIMALEAYEKINSHEESCSFVKEPLLKHALIVFVPNFNRMDDRCNKKHGYKLLCNKCGGVATAKLTRRIDLKRGQKVVDVSIKCRHCSMESDIFGTRSSN